MNTLRYYSDAEDMLFDLARTDYSDRDLVSDVDKENIIMMAKEFGRSAQEIARALMLERVQVERVLEQAYSPALSPM